MGAATGPLADGSGAAAGPPARPVDGAVDANDVAPGAGEESRNPTREGPAPLRSTAGAEGGRTMPLDGAVRDDGRGVALPPRGIIARRGAAPLGDDSQFAEWAAIASRIDGRV